MEGAGVIQIHPNSRNGGKGTLEYLSKNNPQKFGHLLQDDGWIERKDVFVRYGSRKGPLKPGFGFRSSSIGPELGFGTVVGDALEEPVLLIKTC